MWADAQGSVLVHTQLDPGAVPKQDALDLLSLAAWQPQFLSAPQYRKHVRLHLQQGTRRRSGTAGTLLVHALRQLFRWQFCHLSGKHSP